MGIRERQGRSRKNKAQFLQRRFKTSPHLTTSYMLLCYRPDSHRLSLQHTQDSPPACVSPLLSTVTTSKV